MKELLKLFGFGFAGYACLLLYSISQLKVAISKFQIYKINKDGLKFRICLFLDNMRGFAGLNMKNATFNISINRQRITTIRERKDFKIKAGATSEMEFFIILRWSDIWKTMQSLLNNNLNCEISLNGNITFMGVPVKIPSISIYDINLFSLFASSKEEEESKENKENEISNNATDTITEPVMTGIKGNIQ